MTAYRDNDAPNDPNEWWSVPHGGSYLMVLGPWRNAGGTVHGITCAEQEGLARVYGARLPTESEFDAIWHNADIAITKVFPPTAPLDALDATLRGHLAVTPRVACGKTWIRHIRKTSQNAVNYGLHVPPEQVKNGSWRGIKVHRDTTGRGWVVQSPGAVHGYTHADWSQLGYLVRDYDPCTDGSYPPRTPVTTPATPEAMATTTIIPPAPRVPDTDPAAPAFSVELPPIQFIQARNYTRAGRGSIDLVVIHTMEAAEKPSTAENVARWFAGAQAPRASAHYCVDADSIVQCVDDRDVAWAAPKMNRNGLQIEHAGYARQTAAEWGDAFSVAMLDLSALLVAHKCKQWDIPPRFLTIEELRNGARGLVTHHDGTRAFGISGGHVDPGPHFPKRRYEELVAMNLSLL